MNLANAKSVVAILSASLDVQAHQLPMHSPVVRINDNLGISPVFTDAKESVVGTLTA